MRTALVLVTAAAAAALVAACTIEVAGPVGKTCVTANDCPDGLVCVAARPGQGRTCESLALPQEGEAPAADAGFADYCHDVKPVLDTYCVSCHGVPPAGGAPPTFRLDLYQVDGGLGAKDEAARIHARTVVTRDMPPASSPQPTDEERAVVAAWYQSGATECADLSDAGVDADAGTDAGM